MKLISSILLLAVLPGFASCKLKDEQDANEDLVNTMAKEYNNSLDSLKALYGEHKDLPPGLELQTLLALSHYPELKGVRIRFLVKNSFIPLSSRPYVVSLFQKRVKREYQVVISDKSLEAMDPVLAKNLPFNAQVAIIGHELAHTSHYQQMNIYQVQFSGIAYFCPLFRAWFEKGTDRRTIEHGLGTELLEYAVYVRNIYESKEQQVNFMDRYYLNPAEIKAIIEELEINN